MAFAPLTGKEKIGRTKLKMKIIDEAIEPVIK
jgi:hypothetical protein